MENRITIVVYPNTDIVEINVTKKLFKRTSRYGEEPSKGDAALEKRLNAVLGVQKAGGAGETIRIERHEGFYWREIMPAIVAIIVKKVRFDEFNVEVRDTRSNKEEVYHGDDPYPVSSSFALRERPDFGLPYTFFKEGEPPRYLP